ncbi:hypothetical protein FVE85_3577 [Porphyridium purpureum]|uniref:Uncharacterized protein n=1 Tax=Porphyridium purpureum TaxID=35688 RepID=A0A5J4YKY6_PORPP|nr:hypothetical protein FVE85_3577 [Porphyridium purpureum]|eukprot:POR9223..scf249_10
MAFVHGAGTLHSAPRAHARGGAVCKMSTEEPMTRRAVLFGVGATSLAALIAAPVIAETGPLDVPPEQKPEGVGAKFVEKSDLSRNQIKKMEQTEGTDKQKAAREAEKKEAEKKK